MIVPPDFARSLQLVLDDIAAGKAPAAVSCNLDDLYRTLYANVAANFVGGPELIDPAVVCERLAGKTCLIIYAAREVAALRKELAAIKETFNIP